MKYLRSLIAPVVLIASVACSRQAAEAPTSAAASRALSHAPLATFPPLGPAKRVEQGVLVHQVLLGATRVWIYLPA